ncbi:MAG: hypothetical protein LUG18_12275 [Candidatus Azobacteroides sp.]|nr:hypothetical protein [Candidatus Azobacteroides sp.]
MKRVIFIMASILLLVSGCKNTNPKDSEELKKLQEENDSLRLAGVKQNEEYNEMLSLINEVEDNLRKIKETENYLTEQSQLGGELNQSARERINNDMQLLAETLQKNKSQISKLQGQLKSSGIKSDELEKRLAALVADIEEKTASIAALQDELERQNIIIVEQGQRIQEQSSTIEQHSQTISHQDKTLNTGYYVFGTKKELEQEKILVKGKLMQQGYNQDYFTKVDIRELQQVPLYSKKVKMLSTHPASSYKLEKGPDGNQTLVITNKAEFWSISKYLVIQVN